MSPFQDLIPCVFLIQLYIIQLTQATELILERCLGMMFLLTFDVVGYGIHMALADTECSITILPCEWVEMTILLIDPFGRV